MKQIVYRFRYSHRRKKRHSRVMQNQQAFTIVELLIATTVFSIVLLLVTAGIIQIGKNYYKGVIQARTQETARSIIDEISRGIQFSGEKIIATTPYPGPPPNEYGFCINSTGYAYVLDKQLATSTSGTDQVDKTLITYPATCNSFTIPDVSTKSGKERLGLGMRLIDLQITNPSTDTYRITVSVGTGDRDLFSPAYPAISSSCNGGPDAQYCAVSNLSTTVVKRVK